MKRALPSLLTLSLLLSILFIPNTTLGQTTISPEDQATEDQSTDVDDTAPVARVARLSFVDGDVSFLRAGVTEWAPAVENLPLLAGDQIFTGRGARAEVQLARDNYIRLPESTELTITELSDSAVQFEITEGTAIIRIERLATVFGRFEVDTPNSAVLIQQDGLYRIDVRGENDSGLIVRRGEAEVSTDEGSFRVREGHKLLVDTATAGKLEIAVDNSRDDWDQWSYNRDTTVAATSADLAPDYVTSYETGNSDLYGVSDLSSYGTWTSYSSYGQCWIPRVGSDWAPYRSGQWLWIPAAGWTWLSSEPWGWAPYHYGRWSYLSGIGWAWIPGFGSSYRGYGYRDYRWRPALVYFFNSPTPRGNYVGWYPLAPGERWRRNDNRRGDDRAHLFLPSPRNSGPRPGDGKFGIRPPKQHLGVTILPVEGFTRGNRSGVRPEAPSRELSGLIDKSARGGLPEMRPNPVAAAPALAENDQRRLRRIAVPPAEIIKRPVVIRNPNVDSSARSAAPRERRLIVPQKPEVGTQVPALRERGAGPGFDRRPKSPVISPDSQSGADTDGGKRSPKVRVPLPVPAEKTGGDASAGERKRARDGDSGAPNSVSQPEGGNNAAKEERRRTRQEQPPVAKPRESAPSTDQQRDNSYQREKKPPTQDARPREDSQPRVRVQEPPRSQDRGGSSPRVEPKQEQPHSDNQSHEERHQEKEQRQQQPEQRKKP